MMRKILCYSALFCTLSTSGWAQGVSAGSDYRNTNGQDNGSRNFSGNSLNVSVNTQTGNKTLAAKPPHGWHPPLVYPGDSVGK